MKIEWEKVRRVLVVRLRSIGDTVLATPSLIALRRFLPEAQIDILLEDWVAPVLEGFEAVDNIITIPTKSNGRANEGKISKKELLFVRANVARALRRNKYDAAFNLHGGTTATFFVRISGAKHRVGYKNYQFNFLYNHTVENPQDFWKKENTHSAENQLALVGAVGVPVSDKPESRLSVTEKALKSFEEKLNSKAQSSKTDKLALFHPAAAFPSKQWATENFARVAEFLSEKGFQIAAVALPQERAILENLERNARVPVLTFDDLTLPEITALAAKARIFVGNDSGIAHIAAAVQTPTVVVFGSSNIYHWRPWTNAPNEIVFFNNESQSGAVEKKSNSDKKQNIEQITIDDVRKAIENVLLKIKS